MIVRFCARRGIEKITARLHRWWWFERKAAIALAHIRPFFFFFLFRTMKFISITVPGQQSKSARGWCNGMALIVLLNIPCLLCRSIPAALYTGSGIFLFDDENDCWYSGPLVMPLPPRARPSSRPGTIPRTRIRVLKPKYHINSGGRERVYPRDFINSSRSADTARRVAEQKTTAQQTSNSNKAVSCKYLLISKYLVLTEPADGGCMTAISETRHYFRAICWKTYPRIKKKKKIADKREDTLLVDILCIFTTSRDRVFRAYLTTLIELLTYMSISRVRKRLRDRNQSARHFVNFH